MNGVSGRGGGEPQHSEGLGQPPLASDLQPFCSPKCPRHALPSTPPHTFHCALTLPNYEL